MKELQYENWGKFILVSKHRTVALIFVIRSAHDKEYRKLKNETKKLLEVVGNVKRSAAHTAQKQISDIAKLSEEIAVLEKKNICTSAAKGIKIVTTCDAKVDQLTATAKAEIQKLVSQTCSAFLSRNIDWD